MSESDSDLNYESADEDTTEHDISDKENLSVTVDAAKDSSDTAVAAEDNPSAQKLDKKVGSENRLSDTETKVSESREEQKSSDEVIKENENKIKYDPREVKENSPMPEQTVTESIKSKPETQRVPLRLEKKIQQKSQFRESSIENSESSSNVVETGVESNSEANSVKEKPAASSWGFSSWGTSILSTAASSVSTFSSQVSQGIGTVFETVESTLGAPSPEELATVLKEKKEKEQKDNNEAEKEEEVCQSEGGLGILPGVSTWTKVLENTGSKVIMGGLDTLELIGKKTMDILTEGDPRLMNKRNVFSEGINLSQILREAKEKAEKESEEKGLENSDIINYSQIFDEQQGLVHLEALEMLSKQTQATFQRLLMRHSRKTEVRKRLEEIKSVCENIPALDDPSEAEGFEDFESVFKKHALELNIPLNVDNIVRTRGQLNDTISKHESISEEPFITPDEIYSSSISSLAIFTARCIETFHKIAELVLVQSNLAPDIEQFATNLTGLTTVMCIEINNLSSRYHKCLDSSDKHFPNYKNFQDLNITAMVTNLYVEASNSNKYIQDAFQMLVPVLQVCLLESLED